ncbi:TIGR01741 family protein [Bacillus halotolerans]|nr:TIGR01741 family protein [Bacillus halotolerans]PRP58815.1 TIGR01741 family protein [Bacillus halotolerans]PRP62681.1 TIGR01741 family protein [Bacillus halotolerans]
MGHLNQQIAEQHNEMIPSEWTKIILYAEILDDSSEVYFFFNTPQSEEYIYSMIYRNNSMLVKKYT